MISEVPPPLLSDETVYEASLELHPSILYKEKPRHTEEAMRQHARGSVFPSLVFKSDGKISNPIVILGQPYGLNEELIKAGHKIRFSPAIKDGKPVSVRMTAEFSFDYR